MTWPVHSMERADQDILRTEPEQNIMGQTEARDNISKIYGFIYYEF